MEKSDNYTNLSKCTYTWNIPHFVDYLNFIGEHATFTISSKRFEIGENDNLTFFLTMTASQKSFVCSLYRSINTRYMRMKSEMKVLGYDHESCLMSQTNHWTGIEATRTNLMQLKFDSTEPISIMWSNLNGRYCDVPNNALKVQCNITVLIKNIAIQPNYTPKAYPSIKDHYKEMLQNEIGTDVVLEVNEKEFKAHQLILSARSPVFAAMFKHDFIEKKTNRVKIEDISTEIFEFLLYFIYTDEIEKPLELESGISLLEAASRYQVDGLISLCATQLFKLITMENAVTIQIAAQNCNLTDFAQSIDAYIKFRQINMFE